MKQEEIIKFKNVHKDYVMGDSKIHAVEAVNLSIKRGDFYCVNNPN